MPDLGAICVSLLERDPTLPFTIRQLNNWPENVKRRVYRGLIPPSLLSRFGIDPVEWTGANKEALVFLEAASGTDKMLITARGSPDPSDEFFSLELADNALNGIELNLLVLNDPTALRFSMGCTEEGQPTMFGTLRRNLKAEELAKRASLAPGQVRGACTAPV